MTGQELTRLLALLQDPARVVEIPVTEIPILVGDLERLKALLFARLVTPPSSGDGQPGTGAEADRLLTIPEVADILAVPKGYAYELARRGKLPVVRVGAKYIRVRLADLREWVARHHDKELDKPSSVTLPSRHDRPGGTENPQAARAHAGPIRQPRRGPPRHRGPVGAGDLGDPRVGRPAHPAPGEDGTEA